MIRRYRRFNCLDFILFIKDLGLDFTNSFVLLWDMKEMIFGWLFLIMYCWQNTERIKQSKILRMKLKIWKIRKPDFNLIFLGHNIEGKILFLSIINDKYFTQKKKKNNDI